MSVELATVNNRFNGGESWCPTFFNQVAQIFCDADPLMFIGGCKPEDYSPVVSSVLARLKPVVSVQEISNVVYEEFLRWFGAGITGPRDKYIPIAEKIWVLLRNPIEFKVESGCSID